MLVEATVCDKCRRLGVPTVRYTITNEDGRQGHTDRCAEDASEFEAVLSVEPAAETETAAAPAAAPTPKAADRSPRRSTRRRTPVTTIDEINKAKAKSKP